MAKLVTMKSNLKIERTNKHMHNDPFQYFVYFEFLLKIITNPVHYISRVNIISLVAANDYETNITTTDIKIV